LLRSNSLGMKGLLLIMQGCYLLVDDFGCDFTRTAFISVCLCMWFAKTSIHEFMLVGVV